MEGITHIDWGSADAEKNRGDFGRIREEVQTFDHRSRVCIICRGILSNSTNGLYEHVQASKEVSLKSAVLNHQLATSWAQIF